MKGEGNFIPEVSMDETDRAQSPVELLIILAAIAAEGIPIQTIAPKFSGRLQQGRGLRRRRGAVRARVPARRCGNPVRRRSLRPACESQAQRALRSDKFSIYPAIHSALKKFDAGVHLKTAGTTWLEELIGLAEAGGAGFALAKEIYAEAFAHREELCGPYATVIDIDPATLPAPETVAGWTSEQYTSALRHVQSDPAYNPSLRQLLHVGFKVAAKMGSRYLNLLEANEAVIAKNVTGNLYERHILPVFFGVSSEAQLAAHASAKAGAR